MYRSIRDSLPICNSTLTVTRLQHFHKARPVSPCRPFLARELGSGHKTSENHHRANAHPPLVAQVPAQGQKEM